MLQVTHQFMLRSVPLPKLFDAFPRAPPGPSHMLNSPNHLSTHFRPVDAVVEVFVNQAADSDVVASDEVETVTDFRAWLGVILGSNNSFNGFIQDDVGELVAGKKSTN